MEFQSRQLNSNSNLSCEITLNENYEEMAKSSKFLPILPDNFLGRVELRDLNLMEGGCCQRFSRAWKSLLKLANGSMLTHFNFNPTDDLRADIPPPPLLSPFFSLLLPPYPLKDRHIMRLNDRAETTLTRNRPPHEPDEKWILDSRRACTPPFSIAEEKPAWGGIDIPAEFNVPFSARPDASASRSSASCLHNSCCVTNRQSWSKTRARRRIV